MSIESGSAVTTTELTEHECWQLLEQHDRGRVGVTRNGEPAIFPVGYSVVPGGLVIRTAPGSKLLAILLDDRVAFELDGVDGDRAWSVMVSGWAEELNAAERAQSTAPASRFAGADAHAMVRITPASITGRVLQRG